MERRSEIGGDETTQSLIHRAAGGEREAADRLFGRYAPVVQRWAHGRLPRWARDIADTTDIVQDALLQSFRNLGGFEYRGEGAFYAYLRAVVMNRIREEIRKRGRRPEQGNINSPIPADATSPLEIVIGHETIEQYEQALSRLPPQEREAIIARVELGLSYEQLAEAIGRPSPDAARMFVGRALVRLAREMNRP